MHDDIGRFKTETGVEKSLDRAVHVIIIANRCSFFAKKTKPKQKTNNKLMHLLKLCCKKLGIPSLGKLGSSGYSGAFLLCHIFFLLVLAGGRRRMRPKVLPGTHHSQKLVETASVLQLLGGSCCSTFDKAWGVSRLLFSKQILVLLGRGGMERNPPSNHFVLCLIVLILTVLDTDQIVNLVVSVIFILTYRCTLRLIHKNNRRVWETPELSCFCVFLIFQ